MGVLHRGDPVTDECQDVGNLEFGMIAPSALLSTDASQSAKLPLSSRSADYTAHIQAGDVVDVCGSLAPAQTLFRVTLKKHKGGPGPGGDGIPKTCPAVCVGGTLAITYAEAGAPVGHGYGGSWNTAVGGGGKGPGPGGTFSFPDTVAGDGPTGTVNVSISGATVSVSVTVGGVTQGATFSPTDIDRDGCPLPYGGSGGSGDSGTFFPEARWFFAWTVGPVGPC